MLNSADITEIRITLLSFLQSRYGVDLYNSLGEWLGGINEPPTGILTADPNYQATVDAYHRLDNPATAIIVIDGEQYAGSTFAFSSLPAGSTLLEPVAWMEALNFLYQLDLSLIPEQPSSGGGGVVQTQRQSVFSLYYATFATLADATAGAPTSVNYTGDGFELINGTSDWTLTLPAVIPAGQERYVIQMSASPFGTDQWAVAYNPIPVQDSNSQIATQYSVDAINWHNTRATTDNYFRSFNGSEFSPAVRYTAAEISEWITVITETVLYHSTESYDTRNSTNGYFNIDEFSRYGIELNLRETFATYERRIKQFIPLDASQIAPITSAQLSSPIHRFSNIYIIFDGNNFSVRYGNELPVGVRYFRGAWIRSDTDANAIIAISFIGRSAELWTCDYKIIAQR